MKAKTSLSTLNEISYYRESRPKTFLLVDTCILLLFLLGTYDPDYLGVCPLMRENGTNYGKEHFDLVKKVLEIFVNQIFITPHVLAEINMLAHKSIKPKDRVRPFFTKMINELQTYKEKQVEMKKIFNNVGVITFGFTDIALIEAAIENKWAILTEDARLYQNYNSNIPIIYFPSVVANNLCGDVLI